MEFVLQRWNRTLANSRQQHDYLCSLFLSATAARDVVAVVGEAIEDSSLDHERKPHGIYDLRK
jgi:hypothetical protein